MNVTVSGSAPTGDTVGINFFGAANTTYTVAAGDTLASSAAGLAAAINANSTDAAHYITATSAGAVVKITSFEWVTTSATTSNGSTKVLTL